MLPTWARPRWKQGLITAWKDLQQFFQAIVAEYEAPQLNSQSLQKLSQEAQKTVYALDKHLEGRKHESMMSGDSIVKREQVIQAGRQIYETLLYLSFVTQTHSQGRSETLSPPEQKLIRQILAAFEVMPDFIGTRFSPQLPLIPHRSRLSALIDNSTETGNLSQLSFFLALNQLGDAIERFGYVRQSYSVQQRSTQ